MKKKQINEIIYYEMTHKWVRVGTKWYREEIPLVVPPPLTPDEEKELQEEERLAKIKCQQELDQLDEDGLTEEDKWILYKEKYFGKEVN